MQNKKPLFYLAKKFVMVKLPNREKWLPHGIVFSIRCLFPRDGAKLPRRTDIRKFSLFKLIRSAPSFRKY